MKKSFLKFSIVPLLFLLIISCSNKEKSGECSTFLECLDGTYWTTNDNLSIWTSEYDFSEQDQAVILGKTKY